LRPATMKGGFSTAVQLQSRGFVMRGVTSIVPRVGATDLVRLPHTQTCSAV